MPTQIGRGSTRRRPAWLSRSTFAFLLVNVMTGFKIVLLLAGLLWGSSAAVLLDDEGNPRSVIMSCGSGEGTQEPCDAAADSADTTKPGKNVG